MTVVVDYNAGNLRSAENALNHLGVRHIVTRDPELIRTAERLVIPGDGEARAVMDVLAESGMRDALDEAWRGGVPILGICIGAQIVLDSSAERETQCLGYVPGRAELIPHAPGRKVPHMGWNTLRHERTHPLLDGVPEDASFYFVHSYAPQLVSDGDVVASCEYGVTFAAIVGKKNVVATQFHPEKSGEPGLRMIANFFAWQP